MFRNARIFVFTAAEGGPTEHQFESAVAGAAWRPLAEGQPEIIAFCPLHEGDETPTPVHANGWLVAKIRHTERKVPPKAIKEVTDDRVREAERLYERPLRAAERREIQMDVRSELTAAAPPQSSYYWLAYHPERRLLVLDGSAKQAELGCSLLRAALQNHADAKLPVTPAQFGRPVEWALTEWLRSGDLPGDLKLGWSCDLQDPMQTSSQVKFRNHDLSSDEVGSAMEGGMRVTALELDQAFGENDAVTYTLHEGGAITRIQHPEVEPDDDSDDPEAHLTADLICRLANIHSVIDMLSRELGGEQLEGVAA